MNKFIILLLGIWFLTSCSTTNTNNIWQTQTPKITTEALTTNIPNDTFYISVLSSDEKELTISHLWLWTIWIDYEKAEDFTIQSKGAESYITIKTNKPHSIQYRVNKNPKEWIKKQYTTLSSTEIDHKKYQSPMLNTQTQSENNFFTFDFSKIFPVDNQSEIINKELTIETLNETWDLDDMSNWNFNKFIYNISHIQPFFSDDIEMGFNFPRQIDPSKIYYKTADNVVHHIPPENIVHEWESLIEGGVVTWQCHAKLCYVTFPSNIGKNIIEVTTEF